MAYQKLFKTLSKTWLDINDIKEIAECGRDNATKIMIEIEKNVVKQGKKIPKIKKRIIPCESVINYFNINIDFVSQMAQNEKNY